MTIFRRQSLGFEFGLVSTFATDIRTEPLRGVVVEEAFGVGEPHGEVAGVASVLQHRLQWEGIGVG